MPDKTFVTEQRFTEKPIAISLRLRLNLSDKKIQNLFSAIARHYDLLNALLSLKRDSAWRRETVKASGVGLKSKVLDVCTGTGELALAYADQIGTEGFVIAADFCFEMLVIGDEKVERKDRGAGTDFSGGGYPHPSLFRRYL